MTNSPKKEQTHCINGHEFTEENTYYQIQKGIKCRRCRICRYDKSREYFIKNKLNIYKQQKIRAKRFSQKIKWQLFTLLSNNKKPFCKCCKLELFSMLTLEHENNNGQEERKVFKHNRNIMKLILDYYKKYNSLPSGYAVNCWNCNLSKRSNNGICEHKEQRFEEPLIMQKWSRLTNREIKKNIYRKSSN